MDRTKMEEEILWTKNGGRKWRNIQGHMHDRFQLKMLFLYFFRNSGFMFMLRVFILLLDLDYSSLSRKINIAIERFEYKIKGLPI